MRTFGLSLAQEGLKTYSDAPFSTHFLLLFLSYIKCLKALLKTYMNRKCKQKTLSLLQIPCYDTFLISCRELHCSLWVCFKLTVNCKLWSVTLHNNLLSVLTDWYAVEYV